MHDTHGCVDARLKDYLKVGVYEAGYVFLPLTSYLLPLIGRRIKL